MHDILNVTAEGWWLSLFKVILIDLTLAADNAVVIGMAARNLQGPDRRRAIFIGIVAATIIRIIFAFFAVELLHIVGLLLVGGLLLLYVAWKMWREMRMPEIDYDLERNLEAKPISFRQAVTNIIIADISMSLDNVLAVAGAAREHFDVLIIGLILSISFMGFASGFVAKLLEKYKWIAYIGLGVVLYVAIGMVWEGAEELLAHQ